jgi:hypothetical protein
MLSQPCELWTTQAWHVIISLHQHKSALSTENMTPELRKEASELQLHKRGIRINVQLHVIEADEEINLRKAPELAQRLLALWAVTRAACGEDKQAILHYLQQQQLDTCLSYAERQFLENSEDEKIETQRQNAFQDRLHAFGFLAWCAGLVPKIDLSQKPLNLQEVFTLFPAFPLDVSQAPAFAQQMKLRRKDVIMDWSDLLYRLHWAVRHASLNHKPSPGNINPDMVREWHQAVNWMCCYDDENNWDVVSTETTA